MAKGDYSRQIKVEASDEIGQLGETFNFLAERLSYNIREITSEKSKVEAIINNMSDGVIALDGRGRLIHINPAARSLLAILKTDPFSAEDSGFNVLKKMLGRENMRLFTQQKRSFSTEISREKPPCTVKVTLVPFKVEKGRMNGTLLVLHDITGERELSKRQQEFVADVSHELRTPLTSIKTYLEALIDHPDESPELRESFLNVINSETERMVRMVEDLLILSRNEARRDEFRLVSVEDIIHDIVQGIDVQVSNKNLRLNLRVAMHLPLVMGDGDQLHRLFLNIVNNALKYTSTGGITVTAGSRSNYLEVSVKDTGIGIPGDALGRIFERFFRVDKARSRKDGGSGLGMSIAKQIAEGHGGTINIASQEGKGTEVTITLPIAARKKLHLDTKAKRGAKGDR
jgi:two-component system sensor histidine kinase VicK